MWRPLGKKLAIAVLVVATALAVSLALPASPWRLAATAVPARAHLRLEYPHVDESPGDSRVPRTWPGAPR